MNRISKSEYEAIGRVAVESGTLERELGEYLVRLSVPKIKQSTPVSERVNMLMSHLATGTLSLAASGEFDFVLSSILELLQRRNALAHGTWSEHSNVPTTLGEVHVVLKGTTVDAKDIGTVAKKLRLSRKLLLRLFHDHLPLAAGHKECPSKSAAQLRAEL